ncbi:MAG: hypothetical protein J1E84_02005 [Muribaculaceae bacterium]|nr:hypothetical protein [Muribaculaceae bacterium]
MKSENGTLVTSYTLYQQYKHDEDRLTTAFLHFAHEGGYDFLRELCAFLGHPLPESPVNVYAQRNVKIEEKTTNRPDGLICISPFELIVESKLKAPKDLKQYNKLLKYKESKLKSESDTLLLYITEDINKPSVLTEETAWISWDDLNQLLLDYSNRHSFMVPLYKGFEGLYEIVSFTLNGIPRDELTVIIPTGNSHEFVLKNNLYHCPSNRNFKGAKYMALYFDQKISHVFRIIAEHGQNNGKFADIPDEDIVFELKIIDGIPTFPIQNDKMTKDNTKSTAFTQRHRYCSFNDLENIHYTSELETRIQNRINKFKSHKPIKNN